MVPGSNLAFVFTSAVRYGATTQDGQTITPDTLYNGDNGREVIGRDVYLYFPMDAPLLLVEDPREAVSEEAADGTWPAEVTNEWMARVDESGMNVGDVVELAVRPGGLHLFDPRTGDIIPQ